MRTLWPQRWWCRWFGHDMMAYVLDPSKFVRPGVMIPLPTINLVETRRPSGDASDLSGTPMYVLHRDYCRRCHWVDHDA